MKIEMIGHASVFIETQDAKIMMDPVLWDPHQEGLFDVCPKREVIVDKIPDFDILIISHKHLDHFDIRSLAYLPKNVEVIIPEDDLIKQSLQKLGYKKIYSIVDFQELKIGSSTSFLSTRSEDRVPEFGVLLKDDSGVFWNCVDTDLSLETIAFVLGKYPEIDFLLATWQPMLEMNYQNNDGLSFPYEHYGRLLYNIRLINPKALSPGSNAFKYINGSSFLNQVVFPVTREKFCQDVKGICPYLENLVFSLNPGDSIEFTPSKVIYDKGSCEFVRMIKDDRDELNFSPVTVGNKLIDHNSDNYDLVLMKESIETAITVDLVSFIKEHRSSIFREHFNWKIVYQLEVIFPDSCQRWCFDFAHNSLTLEKKCNPLANLFTYITASALYGLLHNKKGVDYAGLGGYYRSFDKIYLVTPHGLIPPYDYYIPFVDPLASRYANEENEILVRDFEIQNWQVRQPISKDNDDKRRKVKFEENIS
ncbi:MAG: MBL fold metallo-hydrolase [Symploca sp. SIO2D2]|nr:MBL fold metallo-hydrolase [Symploca sp. SIO2D2]